MKSAYTELAVTLGMSVRSCLSSALRIRTHALTHTHPHPHTHTGDRLLLHVY